MERCMWGNYDCLLPAKVMLWVLAKDRENAAAGINDWVGADKAKQEVDRYSAQIQLITFEKTNNERTADYCRSCSFVLAPG